jgi:hypothetical protein
VNRSFLIALLLCVLLACAGPVSAASSGSALAQQDIDPDDVLMSITVEADGDAVWEIEYRTRLETDDDKQAFEELRTDVQADSEPYAERFHDRMNGTADAAENATGREMRISEMTVSAENRTLPEEYGVLTYRFRWSNFASVGGDRIVAGDAIDGLFFDEQTALLVSWPDEYELLEASPEPTETRESVVVYNGPTDFASGEPRLEFAPSGTDTAGEDTPTDGESGDGGSFPASVLSVAVLAVALLTAAGAFVAYRRRDAADTAQSTDTDGTDGADGGAAAARPDAELLSNEEQVLRLIESEGGRMKQQAVAEQLGWTDAKTSQVTKKLRERGDLEGFRLGRENVLSLPDEDGPMSDSDSE